MASQHKQKRSQVTVGVLTVLVVGVLAVLIGWLAVAFTTQLVAVFEVVAVILGWILLPLRL